MFMGLVRQLRDTLKCAIRFKIWKRYAGICSVSEAQARKEKPFKRLLIVPSNPHNIIGSCGDDAMISAIAYEARQRNPECKIGIVTIFPDLPTGSERLNLVAEPIWRGLGCKNIVNVLRRYDAVAVIGADIMDGFFSEAEAIRMWCFADLAERMGLRCFVAGFSFSENVSGYLRKMLSSLSPNLHLYARERQSLDRFNSVSSTPAQLVADVAFRMQPTTNNDEYAHTHAWVSNERGQKRLVIAINTHPMIFLPDCDVEKVAQLNGMIVEAIKRLNDDYAVSCLLVPHDFRVKKICDDTSLAPLHKMLQNVLGEHVKYVTGVRRASDVKGVVGLADALMTSRMHLGVAALSMGLPVWAISQQNKFDGLFAHFGLEGRRRLQPNEALQPDMVYALLKQIVDGYQADAAKVRLALPKVMALSAKNFAPLDE